MTQDRVHVRSKTLNQDFKLMRCLLLLVALVDLPCVLGRVVGPLLLVDDVVNALRDTTVEQVILGAGVLSLDALSALPGGGLTIGPNRQVELVGATYPTETLSSNGTKWAHTQVSAYGTGIDFGSSAPGVFRLADNTTLRFRNLILWHGLSQLGYDWQVVTLTQPGARAAVRFVQTVKLRDGCLPLQIFEQHVTSYTRLPDAKGSQSASLQPFCFTPPVGPASAAAAAAAAAAAWGPGAVNINNGRIICLPEILAITDLATSITRSNGQSYDLYEQNSTYWCRAYASMSCLSASGPEQCVKDLLATAAGNITGALNTSSGPLPASGGDGSSLGSILIPALLVGGIAVIFVLASFWFLNRRGKALRGSSLMAASGEDGEDLERGGAEPGRGVGALVGGALARLLPGAAAREAQKRQPNVPGYVPVVSKEALDRIAKVRAELSSKMVVASSTDDLSDVRNLHLVGKGSFGRVYRGEWKGVTVALKIISVPVSQYGQAQWQQVLGEAAIATLLNHPCVLQTYSVALLEYSPALRPGSQSSEEGGANTAGSGKSSQAEAPPAQAAAPASVSGAHAHDLVPFYQLKMVSEFCEGGPVVQALRRMQFYDSVGGGTVRLPAVIEIASQVACGMAYLHSANIIHADLKAANVLLKQQPGSGRLQAKVADFGLSFRLEDPEATHATKGQLGSITHMAPEVLLHGRVSKSSDVYSFGILLYELYTGQQAYWDVPQPMLAYHVATTGGRPVLPPHCPPPFRDLAKTCWGSEPGSRPTFEQVYSRLQALAADVNRQMNNPPPGAARNTTGVLQATAADPRTNAPAHDQPIVLAPDGVGSRPEGPPPTFAAAGLSSMCPDADSDVLGGRVAPPPSQQPAAAAAAPLEGSVFSLQHPMSAEAEADAPSRVNPSVNCSPGVFLASPDGGIAPGAAPGIAIHSAADAGTRSPALVSALLLEVPPRPTLPPVQMPPPPPPPHDEAGESACVIEAAPVT